MSSFNSQMVVGLGLNDEQFRRGLAEADRQSARAAGRIEGHWKKAGDGFTTAGRKLLGIGGGALGVATAVLAVRKISEGFREAIAQSDTLKDTWQSWDPWAAFKMPGRWLARRAEANDFLGLSSAGAAKNAAEQSARDLDARLEVRRQLADASLQVAQAEAAIAEAQNQPGRAAALREIARHEGELLAIRRQYTRGGAARGPEEAENRLHAANTARLQRDDARRMRDLWRPIVEARREVLGMGATLTGSAALQAAATSPAQRLAADLASIDEQFNVTRRKLESDPAFRNEQLDGAGLRELSDLLKQMDRNREAAKANAVTAYGAERDRAVRDLDQQWNAERRLWDIQQLRLAGKSKEADLAEIELEFDQKRMDIWKQDWLPESERNRRIDIADQERDQFLRERMRREEKILGGMTLSSGGIGLGGAGSELRAQVLGGTGGPSLLQQQVEQSKAVVRGVDDTNAILERIERKIGPVAAVLT